MADDAPFKYIRAAARLREMTTLPPSEPVTEEDRMKLKTCHIKCELFAEKIFANLIRNGHRDHEIEEIANLSVLAAAIFYSTMEKSRWQIDQL